MALPPRRLGESGLCRLKQDRIEQSLAHAGKAVHHHLALTPGLQEFSSPQHAHMVRDEILRAADNPRKVADAELSTVAECRRNGETRWITKRLGLIRRSGSVPRSEPFRAELLTA